MAKKKDGETQPDAEARAEAVGEVLVPDEVPAVEPTKKIRFTAFKTHTSRGRRLEGDVDDFPASEAGELIAAGHAVEWQ